MRFMTSAAIDLIRQLVVERLLAEVGAEAAAFFRFAGADRLEREPEATVVQIIGDVAAARSRATAMPDALPDTLRQVERRLSLRRGTRVIVSDEMKVAEYVRDRVRIDHRDQPIGDASIERAVLAAQDLFSMNQ